MTRYSSSSSRQELRKSSCSITHSCNNNNSTTRIENKKSSTAKQIKKRFVPFRKCNNNTRPSTKRLSFIPLAICYNGQILGMIPYQSHNYNMEEFFGKPLSHLRRCMKSNNRWIYDQDLDLQDFAFAFQNTKLKIPQHTEQEEKIGDILLQCADNEAVWAIQLSDCKIEKKTQQQPEEKQQPVIVVVTEPDNTTTNTKWQPPSSPTYSPSSPSYQALHC